MAQNRTATPDDDLIAVDGELEDMLRAALRGVERGGISRIVLDALKAATERAINRQVRKEREAITSREWTPTPDQVWSNGMRTKDNKRLTAQMVFEKGYAKIPFDERPYAHQVRQHPETHELYRALCVMVSRNKARGQTPASINELFPVTREARGGMLADHSGRRE